MWRALLLFAACSSPLEMRGSLAPLEHEARALAADMLSDLGEWHIVVTAEPNFLSCAGSDAALGCTSYSTANRWAYVRLAMAPGWPLRKTSFIHEITHLWLLETTGDGDAEHISEVWQK